MRENPDCREFYLSFVPENTGAAALYESIGFERTGEISEGEIVSIFEAVQVAIIVVLFPVLLVIRKAAPRTGLALGVSVAACVALVGLVWFVQRLLGIG